MQCFQFVEDFENVFRFVDGRAFRNLQFQILRFQLCFLQNAFESGNEIRISQLYDGYIDRNAHIRKARQLPCFTLHTGCPQHPLADGNNQSGLFCQRDKLIRRNHAKLGMIPSEEGFCRYDSFASRANLRLKMQHEFIFCECAI